MCHKESKSLSYHKGYVSDQEDSGKFAQGNYFFPKSERKIALRKRKKKKVLLRSVFVYVFPSKTTELGKKKHGPSLGSNYCCPGFVSPFYGPGAVSDIWCGWENSLLGNDAFRKQTCSSGFTIFLSFRSKYVQMQGKKTPERVFINDQTSAVIRESMIHLIGKKGATLVPIRKSNFERVPCVPGAMSQTKKIAENSPRAIIFFFFNPKSEERLHREREKKKSSFAFCFCLYIPNKTTELGKKKHGPSLGSNYRCPGFVSHFYGPEAAKKGATLVPIRKSNFELVPRVPGAMSQTEKIAENSPRAIIFSKVREKDCIEKEKKSSFCVLFLHRPSLGSNYCCPGFVSHFYGPEAVSDIWFG
ncbi:hypothetical protein CEXT_223971 [Caerostris extrusa]|uniref:Ribosomal protein S11 n=1 Tax=Caerostris extrusa TaxID=172846 RepID=A0AAV4MWG5_CAEEX|nr:hypothetical protein CEXT_223971 [Caerostris extrusa]